MSEMVSSAWDGIALLTHSVNPRGGVVHTLELARALHAAGQRVTVMAPAAPGQSLFRAMPCDVVLIPVAPAPRDVAEMVATRIKAIERHLASLIKQGACFGVWHAQDPISANALANLQGAGLIGGYVRTVHHLEHFDDARLMAWQQRGFETARQLLCVSRLWAGVLRWEHGQEAALVHNGVDLERFTPSRDERDAAIARLHGLRAGMAAGAPVFLAVGGIEPRKNTLRILEAFLAVRADWPQAQLVIVGGASLLDHAAYALQFDEALRASGLAVGPGEAVVVTGTVPDAHMPALFRAADALLMPSLCEGFGLVVLEALACGTPALVSRMAPFTEYLDREDAVWADPMDTGSIAEAMRQMLDPARPATLVREPPAVCRRFSWQASARRHMALYGADLGTAHPSSITGEPDHARNALPASVA